MSNCFNLSVEIELPEGIAEDYQETVIEDLNYELHLIRLRGLIKRWARQITGENCHVEITVD